MLALCFDRIVHKEIRFQILTQSHMAFSKRYTPVISVGQFVLQVRLISAYMYIRINLFQSTTWPRVLGTLDKMAIGDALF